MTYAEETAVPIDRSRAEIERLLQKAGATERGQIFGEKETHIFFRKDGRNVLFKVPMPGPDWKPSDPKLRRRMTLRGRERVVAQEERRRWRSLVLVLKAKLESVESGIEVFEEAFLAQIVLPQGRTVAEEVRPAIARAYEGKGDGRLLPQFTTVREEE